MSTGAGGKRVRRIRNPRPTDETGRRLIDAALELLADGTPFHELRLTDAVARANENRPSEPLTTGAAYPRFAGQPEFRMAVLAEALRTHGVHRREGGRAAQEDLAERMTEDDPLSAEEIERFTKKWSLGAPLCVSFLDLRHGSSVSSEGRVGT